jgi:hypothetical protein
VRCGSRKLLTEPSSWKQKVRNSGRHGALTASRECNYACRFDLQPQQGALGRCRGWLPP